ncbi:MAG: flavin reductase family protein [Bryobacteraceae bacterium]
MSHPASPFDPRLFRNALGRFASGVTIVTTYHEGATYGMTANAFMSVSMSPPLVLVSIDHRAAMHTHLPKSKRYGVSILAEGQQALSNHFAGRSVEGFQVPFIERKGMPLIEGAVAYFVANVVDEHLAGDHTLYIGEVEHFEAVESKPLLFYAGGYQQLNPHS